MRWFAKILLIFAMGWGVLTLSAKEPANWLFGFGIGFGESKIDRKYSNAARNQIGLDWTNWVNSYDSQVKDLGVSWEFLVGYKHWLNDYVGFRYYANIGAQHYKDDIFTAGKVKAGIIEYTANADLLLNFYENESFTFGILGGFGVGGAYFDSPALDTYNKEWSAKNPQWAYAKYDGLAKVKRHHLSANLSIGTRFNIFQRVRAIDGKKICSKREDDRQVCRVPIGRLEHSIEFNAKFSMLTYYATAPGDVWGGYCRNNASDVDGNNLTGEYKCLWVRPGYEVKNPYKLTLRYIFAF